MDDTYNETHAPLVKNAIFQNAVEYGSKTTAKQKKKGCKGLITRVGKSEWAFLYIAPRNCKVIAFLKRCREQNAKLNKVQLK